MQIKQSTKLRDSYSLLEQIQWQHRTLGGFQMNRAFEWYSHASAFLESAAFNKAYIKWFKNQFKCKKPEISFNIITMTYVTPLPRFLVLDSGYPYHFSHAS